MFFIRIFELRYFSPRSTNYSFVPIQKHPPCTIFLAAERKGSKSGNRRNGGSCGGVGGDSGIRFGARCGAVATPARLGIQLTATRDRSLRRFLLGLTGSTKGGCSQRIRPDRHRNCPRCSSAHSVPLEIDPIISQEINDSNSTKRRKE